MNKLSQLWTAGIAYVALSVGAGLSIMYNVLETMAVRGLLLGVPDLITAVAMPGIVVLMVEMFVSRWWIGRPWYMQVVRTAATAGIGGVAMRASWTHGHAWMLSHGQTKDVAMAWPLAIDLLAIVATALILAGRRTPVASGHVATLDLATEAHVGHWPLATPVDEPLANDLANWDAGVDRAIGQAGQELADDAERWLATGQAKAVPVISGQVDVPDSVRVEIKGWLNAGQDVAKGELDNRLATENKVSPRTARRWRAQVTEEIKNEQREVSDE